jgi:hypothetical protein
LQFRSTPRKRCFLGVFLWMVRRRSSPNGPCRQLNASDYASPSRLKNRPATRPDRPLGW